MKFTRSKDKMHRVANDGRPDWEHVATSERNIFQRLAAKTGGIVAPANALSVAGAELMHLGLQRFQQGKKLSGFAISFGGGIVDWVDGIVADKTGTKSSVGAKIDASLDTVKLLEAIKVLHKTGAAPTRLSAIATAHKSVNVLATLTAQAKGKRIETAGEGKIYSLVQGLGFGALMLASGLDENHPNAAKTARLTGGAMILAGSAIGLPATIEYCKVALTDYSQIPADTIAPTDIQQIDPEHIHPIGNSQDITGFQY